VPHPLEAPRLERPPAFYTWAALAEDRSIQTGSLMHTLSTPAGRPGALAGERPRVCCFRLRGSAGVVAAALWREFAPHLHQDAQRRAAGVPGVVAGVPGVVMGMPLCVPQRADAK